MSEEINFPEIDKIVQKIKDLEVEKDRAFRAKFEADMNYIKINQDLRMANIELSKLMASTKQFRRRFPSPDKLWKDRVISEAGKCDECGSVEDLTVHHKTPLGMGGTNQKDNIQVLCRKCHSKYHPI